MYDTLIIGAGPAGISASLYLARAGKKTVILGKEDGSLSKAEKIENYYGLPEPVSGKILLENGIKQAKVLGVDVIREQAVGISYDDTFTVLTENSEYQAKTVIIATGTSRSVPKIKGIKEFEGKGVSWCAICDGFFFRNKAVGVIGSGVYARHECEELLNVTTNVTVFTDGKPSETEFPSPIKTVNEKIAEINGDSKVSSILLENGESVGIDGIFIALGVAGSTDLARKIGAVTDGNRIVVDSKMATGIPGLYAAGDCIGGLLQVSKAVSDGAIAGTECIKYLKSIK